MKAEPWEVGSLPVDCPTCGAVHWAKAPWDRLECCGKPMRYGGGDSKPHAWYVALCESVRAGYRAQVLRSLGAAPIELSREHATYEHGYARGGVLPSDPRPECEHAWHGMGVGVFCDPPIYWSVCFNCRTVLARTWNHGDDPKTDPPSALWYQREWTQGPFDWDAEARRAGAVSA